MIVVMLLFNVCLFLLHYYTCMYMNVALVIKLVVNDIEGWWMSWIMIKWYELKNILVIVMVMFFVDSLPRYCISKLDRLSHFCINIGSGTTFRYANSLCLDFMRGPMIFTSLCNLRNVKLYTCSYMFRIFYMYDICMWLYCSSDLVMLHLVG